MQKKILIIEDDKDLIEAIEFALSNNGYSVITSQTGEKGLVLLKELKPDMVIMDMGLPDVSGSSVCRIIKQDKKTKHIPIIIITGLLKSEIDVVSGIDMGADDYLRKPFGMKELVARIKGLFRRIDYDGEIEEVIKESNINLNIKKMEVCVDDEKIKLTPKEFNLLHTLMIKKNQVLKTEYLLEHIWGDERDISFFTLTVHINRLRKKLGKEAAKKIVTIPCAGYKFEA